ncbi:PIH1 domain-containing protein 1 isoform X2 [Gadus macrocephalus]|uniref:PIH1 domain-containing protein 1 isoform X2 n=1 Tax=Gadus macrocephalus TaxID=80720 RepID=UPI0028CBAB92|nr:PIH1 domain-containing protein 1 isoform X2 [Gadus macrocephalus]
MATDSCLLNSEVELQQQEELYQQLLLKTAGKVPSEPLDSKLIRPQPGMCVKTLSQTDNQKIFVNICQSPSVPPPPELSRDELVTLLQSEDPTGYRVPMSLGEPHTEMDNGSQSCTAYDVVISEAFYQKSLKDPLFQQFLIMVSLEGLENKYHLELSRDWKILKNRKFFGSVSEQNIRTKSQPVIQELPQTPEFSLLVEPPTGRPQYLIAEVQLPGVRSCRALVLDVGEDRLVLTARPNLFHLDVFHPLLVDQGGSVAQFNTHTQILTITMPVVSS